MYPSLYNGRNYSLLKPQLSIVHHRAKDSQASRTNILTAVLDFCKEERGREKEREKSEIGRERGEEGRGVRRRERTRWYEDSHYFLISGNFRKDKFIRNYITISYKCCQLISSRLGLGADIAYTSPWNHL